MKKMQNFVSSLKNNKNIKKIVICLLILSFTSCTKKNASVEKTNGDSQKNQYLIEKDTINGNEYVYYFKKSISDSLKSDHCRLDSLIILRNGEKYLLNLINKDINQSVDFIKGGVYASEDFNFDGINDIMLYPYIKTLSVYGTDNRAYFYIYNKKSNVYENRKELEIIPNLQICKKDKYLFSKNGDQLKKYRWKEDSLKQIESIEQTRLENGFYKIVISNPSENKYRELVSIKDYFSNFQCK